MCECNKKIPTPGPDINNWEKNKKIEENNKNQEKQTHKHPHHEHTDYEELEKEEEDYKPHNVKKWH